MREFNKWDILKALRLSVEPNIGKTKIGAGNGREIKSSRAMWVARVDS